MVILKADTLQRLAATWTKLFLIGHINHIQANWQLRVISAFGCGLTWLLATSILRRDRSIRISQPARPIGGRLFLLSFAEAFRLELSSLSFRLIEFGLQFCVSLYSVGMPALPITNIALQLSHLLLQDRVFLS